MEKGLAVVAINSNDTDKYPEDAPDKMKMESKLRGYNFPYVLDADQSVAKAYRAACTPDFYLFDSNRRLVYRGQWDKSRPGNSIPVDGSSMIAAIESVLSGSLPALAQEPSLGCNIKWKPGNEPNWFG
jgi:hypothetical protein